MNPKPYVLSEQAEDDLARIYAYIARDNPDAAERMLDKGLPKNNLFQEKQETGFLKNDNHFKGGRKGVAPSNPRANASYLLIKTKEDLKIT